MYSVFLTVSGPGKCKINNGGCWHESKDGHTYSACLVSDLLLTNSYVFNKLLYSAPEFMFSHIHNSLNRILRMENASVLLVLKAMVSNA